MSQVAADTGLAREALYRALGAGGNPEFATVVKVATALGLTLSARKNSAA
jgi:probable addiction module antidote protein